MANACVDPRAVVIHLEHTSITFSAVMRPGGLEAIADITVLKEFLRRRIFLQASNVNVEKLDLRAESPRSKYFPNALDPEPYNGS